jgi:UMF1 family MFS transporter
MLVAYTALGIAAVLCIPLLQPGMIGWALAVIIVSNFAFEGGIVFYNSYLPVIAPPDMHGRISAKGYAVGYLGSLVAIAYAAKLRPLDLVWVALAAQWLGAALPGFRALPPDGPRKMSLRAAAMHGLRTTKQTLRDVWGMTNLRRFLIAYFFYMDGVLTVIAFAALYSKSLGFTLTESMGMLALVQITALAGSLLMARPTDRKGPRWAVNVLLMWWIGVVVAAYFSETKVSFTVVAGLAGLGLGSIQSASRAFMSRLIPKGREAEMFGFYGLCGKSGAILGPVIFGIIFKRIGPNEAILSVAVFYVLGFVLLRNVRDEAA